MKRKLNKRAVTLLVCLVILVVASVGATLAYLITATDPVENTFTPARVSCDVVELFENNVKKDVRIQNTGNTDAYIRAAIVVTWKNDDGEIYAVTPMEGKDYEIRWNLLSDGSTGGWIKGADGFYYYNQEVAPVTKCNHETLSCDNCCTGVLITSCSQSEGANAPEDYHLSVEIVASAIQSMPDYVVENEWSNTMVIVKSSNGTLTITNNGG